MDYAKMLVLAEKYANAEEAMVARKETAPNWAEKKEKRKREEPSDESQASWPKSYSNLPPQKFQEYTPLSALQSQILMEVKDEEEFEQPQKMLAPPHKRDQRKYYLFHRDHRHDIDECIQLKDEIEALIC